MRELACRINDCKGSYSDVDRPQAGKARIYALIHPFGQDPWPVRVRSSYCQVVAWLKEAGDTVRRGDSLLMLETDKATIELEAEVSGVLARIIHAAGEWVEVLTVVGTIERNSKPNERT